MLSIGSFEGGYPGKRISSKTKYNKKGQTPKTCFDASPFLRWIKGFMRILHLRLEAL
jgi:hypothetical protein